MFPGLARLVVECEIAYGTARKALGCLRTVGLIELVRRGNRRRGLADEYRLILAVDLLDRLEVLSPEQEQKEIAKVNERNVAAGRDRQPKRSAPPQSGLDDPDDPDGLALSQESANEPISATGRSGLALLPDPPPSIGPLHTDQPPSEVSLPLTLRAREPQEPLFDEEDQPEGTDTMPKDTDRRSEPVQTTPLPQTRDTVVCSRCGARYIDDQDGRQAHAAVFGHGPASAPKDAA